MPIFLLTAGMIFLTTPNASAYSFSTYEEEFEYVLPILERLQELYEQKETANRLLQPVIDYQIGALHDQLNKISQYQRDNPNLNAEQLRNFEIAKELIVNSDLLWTSVSINDREQILEIAIETRAQPSDSSIRKTIDNLISVPFRITYADTTYLACSEQNSDCDPIIGGISINAQRHNPCTIAIPALLNTDNGNAERGFLTAAHCLRPNADIYQPANSNDKVGEVASRVFTQQCDCAFIKTDSGIQTRYEVWMDTDEATNISIYRNPQVDDYVYFVGQTTGPAWGKVTSLDGTFRGIFNHENFIEMIWLRTQHGDSGGPIISGEDGDTFHGILSAKVGHKTYASSWSEIDRALDLR